MVEGINDALAAALIDWYNDIPSMCEQIRTGSYTTIYHDAEVEGKEWVDELDALEEIDNLEMAMKDAQIWQEPENVASGAI
jgi:predicted metal-dependent peptidase